MIINGDKMALHRSESSEQTTLHFKDQDVFVKENMLTRERITCFSRVSPSSDINSLQEFVFKGKGTRTTITTPHHVLYQW